MTPDSFALTKDAYFKSVLFMFASVKSASVSFACARRARCNTERARFAPDRSAPDKSLRFMTTRCREHPGHVLDVPVRNSASPSARACMLSTQHASTSIDDALKRQCEIMAWRSSHQ